MDDLRTVLREELARLSISPKRCDLTWRGLIAAYRDHEQHRQLASWATIEGRLHHIDRILGERETMQADVKLIAAYRNQRARELTIRKKLTTPGTRNREIEYIRRLTRWGATRNPPLLPYDPLASIEREFFFEADENSWRRNIVEEVPRELLTLDVFLSFGDDLDRALVLVAYDSGMRRREIALLEHDWIDREGLLINIPAGICKGRRGKKPERTTVIKPRTLDAIDALPADERWVFRSTRTKGHLHPDTLTSRFTALQRRASAAGPSGPPWLHDLRRSFITLTRRRGGDSQEIMALVGQTSTRAYVRYNVRTRKDLLVLRRRLEDAWAAELAELRSSQRRGPHRAKSAQTEDKSADEKIKLTP